MEMDNRMILLQKVTMNLLNRRRGDPFSEQDVVDTIVSDEEFKKLNLSHDDVKATFKLTIDHFCRNGYYYKDKNDGMYYPII